MLIKTSPDAPNISGNPGTFIPSTDPNVIQATIDDASIRQSSAINPPTSGNTNNPAPTAFTNIVNNAQFVIVASPGIVYYAPG